MIILAGVAATFAILNIIGFVVSFFKVGENVSADTCEKNMCLWLILLTLCVIAERVQ